MFTPLNKYNIIYFLIFILNSNNLNNVFDLFIFETILKKILHNKKRKK